MVEAVLWDGDCLLSSFLESRSTCMDDGFLIFLCQRWRPMAKSGKGRWAKDLCLLGLGGAKNGSILGLDSGSSTERASKKS